MRVLQINAVYKKYSTGRTTQELHETLLNSGIDSYVACSDLAGLKENCYLIGNNFDRKAHAICSRLFGNQGYYSKKATQGLINYIDSIKPDIIHLRNLHGNYINVPDLLRYIAQNNIATVITLHDSWFYTGKCVYYVEVNCNRWLYECDKCPALKLGNPSLFFDRSRKMLLDKKVLFQKINNLAVIGVSQWVTQDAKKSILKGAKITKCIYNWIDLEKFKPRDTVSFRNSEGLNGKKVVLGIAMRWNEAKGISIFHKIADLLPDNYQIVLVGDDSTISSKHPKIKYLGSINDMEKLAMLYSLADVFVNPTIQETFGKTTAEALAAGTPVVAFNGTATPELIGTDNLCGYLIDNNDPVSYCEKIMRIAETTNSEYGINARKRAEILFSKNQNINEYIEVYNELLK